jgi:putative glutamine amidotransferase
VFGTTSIATDPGSRLASLVGDTITVSCHHHQSVREAPGFRAAATAADGTLEAIEAPTERFCVAVQWHPETAADVGLLAGLVAAAREHAAR